MMVVTLQNQLRTGNCTSGVSAAQLSYNTNGPKGASRPPHELFKLCSKMLLGAAQNLGAVHDTKVPEQGGPHPPPLPPCISYANVHNYYGPYAYCSLAIERWKVQR